MRARVTYPRKKDTIRGQMGLNSTPLDSGRRDPAPAAAAESVAAPEGGRTCVELGRAGGRPGARVEKSVGEGGLGARFVFFLFPSCLRF